MKRVIDIDAILAPFSGEQPAGEDLRYSSVYTDIAEARKAEDPLEMGDWKREIKTADWGRVIALAVEALTQKTKDLQIAAWLTEALIKTEGFGGLGTGLKILYGFLNNFWEIVYPQIEDGDLDFRAAPFEFLNDKLWVSVREIPLTDPSLPPGFSYLKWQESRDVGYEAATRNRFGDVEESKKKRRDELISEGKLTAEDFDSAAASSSKTFYKGLAESLKGCCEEFKRLDEIVDRRFGSNAPRLAEFRTALEDCERFVTTKLEEKRKAEPEPEPEPELEPEPQVEAAEVPSQQQENPEGRWSPLPEKRVLPKEVSGEVFLEKAVWEEALQGMKSSGLKQTLGQLLSAANSAPSVRERNRYRLLMARLCLTAGKPELARPIAEELHALIEELHLERWESPLWIAEVLDALYQCLTQGEPSDDDIIRAKGLFQRLCVTDITKALTYKS
jgi:type VI secretion system protein ImpA